MKHVNAICAYIKTLLNNDSFHALVVDGPPGFGKSTTVNRALNELGIQAIAAGSYATPLHIYNTLCQHPRSLIILDDVAGVFNDPKSMAILKAATWPGSGHGSGSDRSTEKRQVAWGSASDKVMQPSVDFSGKLILLTNVVPTGKETEAFISRCLRYHIRVEPTAVKQLLLAAAGSTEHYSNADLALSVARFIVDETTAVDLARISLRTLAMGYALAETHPIGWRELFVPLLPRTVKREDAISQVLQSGLSPKEQEAHFVEVTGKSRRTYYNYKKRLGMTRAYQVRDNRDRA